MKIAVLLHPMSSGGISRFQRFLLKSLAKINRNTKIDIFVSPEINNRDKLDKLLSDSNISFYFLKDLSIKEPSLEGPSIRPKKTELANDIKKCLKKSKIISKLYFFLKISIFKIDIPWYRFKISKDLIKKFNTYDLLYIPGVFFIKPLRLNIPIIITFHDFNWKHNFLGNFNQDMITLLDKQISKWLDIAHMIVIDTDFVLQEMESFYHGAKSDKKVVHLAPFGKLVNDSSKISNVLDKYNLPKEYIIYPGRIATHKNVPNLLKALIILKEQYKLEIPLVLTGDNTVFVSEEYKTVPKDNPLYEVDKTIASSDLKINKNIYPLGYVENDEIDALVKGSSLVVAPSFYEGSAGPPFDAWSSGIPIALSSIPTFTEHIDFLGTKAWVFDPKDPNDIAEKINQAITQKEKSQEMVKISKEAMDKYTWDDVAKEYYKVFKKAVEK